MTRTRLILAIRFSLFGLALVVGCLASGVTFYAAWLVVFALTMPVFASVPECFDGTNNMCNGGTAKTTTSTTISGMAAHAIAGCLSGVTNCSGYNYTFVGASGNFATDCSWATNNVSDPNSEICSKSSANGSELTSVGVFLVTAIAQVQCHVIGQGVAPGGSNVVRFNYRSGDLGAYPIDCSALGSVSCATVVSSGDLFCPGTNGLTITVVWS